MTPEEREQRLSQLSPEMREKLERLHKLRQEADAEDAAKALSLGAVIMLAMRIAELMKLEDDPIVKMCVETIGEEPGAAERFRTFINQLAASHAAKETT